jgi:zinc protease
MQFKGTPTFPARVLDRAISRDGGFWNAFTWLDWTTYLETMPADRIELALQLEADRMANSLFDPSDVESERTVVISERQGRENEPTFRLSEEVQAAAFRVHAYHHVVIGDMIDLRTMQREDLYSYYQRYYTPRNAILALAGDFRTRSMLQTIRSLFGPIPSQPRPKPLIRPEPPQRGERRVTVEGPGETPFLEVAYHVPPAREADFMPLAVLDSVLAGASSFNPFETGISNKTSRLYRALVEPGLAASVRGFLATTIDPYVYTLRATVQPGSDPNKACQALDNEIDRVCQGPIDDQEVAKAIKQARALFTYSSETVTSQAFWLGFSEMFADYDWFETYLERIQRVTADDVLRVAQKYLIPSNRVLGIYRPTGGVRHA